MNTLGDFQEFIGDHFARVESSGDQNLTMSILDFYVFVAKLSVTPQLGLQRHLASKGAPKGSQGVPKVFQKDCKESRK